MIDEYSKEGQFVNQLMSYGFSAQVEIQDIKVYDEILKTVMDNADPKSKVFEQFKNVKVFNKIGKKMELCFFTEGEVIKETEKALLAVVPYFSLKKMGLIDIKKWIPKSYLYVYEFENGYKNYFINRCFIENS